MTPTDHTSTLLEILGGSFPTTKHSGGKYLKWRRRQNIFLFMTLFFQQDGRSPFPDCWTLLYSSPRTSSGVPVQNIFLKYQRAIIKFFTAKPFTELRPINCSLLSPLAEIAFTQQNNRFMFLKILAAAAGWASPVCSCSLWRQLHPIYGVVAVIVHDLWQAKVCDLDLSTGGAIHQQDVT